MKASYRGFRTLVVALHLLSPVAATRPAFALTGGATLPAPSVSKALDAILLPVDAAVAREFKLGAGRKGVLVLAVQPGGVADRQGIEAGDVLVEILGRPVRKPIDVDAAVRRGLRSGTTSYGFDLDRGGAAVAVVAVITLVLYEEAFTVSEISSWESWSETTSFSYSEFVSEYSETIESSYESEETMVEEAISEDEATGEDEATDDPEGDDAADGSGDGPDEGADDGTPDAADAGDEGADDAVEDGGDDAAEDGAEDGADDAADEGGDDGADEGADDAAEDDGGGDDASGDDGGDDSGGDDE